MITIVLAAALAATTAQPASPPMDHSKHQQGQGESKGMMDCAKMPCCAKMSAAKADKAAPAKPAGHQH